MTASSTAVTDQLRAWARGMYTTEAATELLIRAFTGTFASTDRPWITATASTSPVPPYKLARFSGGEQRLLRIAASIGSDEAPPVDLGDAITGLDRPTLRLVLAAIAHAGGSHQHYEVVIDRGGRATLIREASLYAWDHPTHGLMR